MPRRTHTNKVYRAELKQRAVQDYLAGEGSLRQICKQHKIKAKTQLLDWISCNNGHKDLKARSGVKGDICMTKGRKTTQEESAEIVAFCIEHSEAIFECDSRLV